MVNISVHIHAILQIVQILCSLKQP